MDYKIKSHEFDEVNSASIDWNGWNFLTIFGKSRDGWFVAIPNWEICVEIAPPNNTRYNSDKIGLALNKQEAGKVIAKVIKDHFECE